MILFQKVACHQLVRNLGSNYLADGRSVVVERIPKKGDSFAYIVQTAGTAKLVYITFLDILIHEFVFKIWTTVTARFARSEPGGCFSNRW